MKKFNQVAVYAASSSKVAQVYFDQTKELAKILAQEKIRVVYGGGGSGLMGCLADSVLAEGGFIKGIIPGFMRIIEWQHNGLTELEIVADMHERKAKFLRKTDAVIALPGGCGTLEELLEVITLKRLGKFEGPIILVNTNDYYAPLIKMLETCISQHFMAESHRQIWSVIESPNQLMETLQKAAAEWKNYTIDQAVV